MTDVRASGLESLLAGGQNFGRRVDRWAAGGCVGGSSEHADGG